MKRNTGNITQLTDTCIRIIAHLKKKQKLYINDMLRCLIFHTFLPVRFAASTTSTVVVCCFRFCSDTFGNDPPLNVPKFVEGARFFFD